MLNFVSLLIFSIYWATTTFYKKYKEHPKEQTLDKLIVKHTVEDWLSHWQSVPFLIAWDE